MQFAVPLGPAAKLDREKNTTVTIVNQLAVDVYLDSDPMRLNRTAPGVVPDGTKIAANGGTLQISDWSKPLYLRAVSATAVEVQP